MSRLTSQIEFDKHSTPNAAIVKLVEEMLRHIITLETEMQLPIIIFQDGANGAYNAKFSLLASTAKQVCDLDAKLDFSQSESYRANRTLLKQNLTYKKMMADAKQGREFNDIIVEYTTVYTPEKPLKVWGGQHRISALSEAADQINRYHGFRIYFDLTKKQRNEVAFISNTNIAVSNDTFDRMIEEAEYGNKLRQWARNAGLLDAGEDFPDSGAKSDKITVKKARSFIVNFYLAQEQGKGLAALELDQRVYEPYLCKSGSDIVDPEYARLMNSRDILKDEALLDAGKAFFKLHRAQVSAARKEKALARKAFRNKALIESVLCGWSYVAGLLQSHSDRLANHYQLPKTDAKKGVPDPLSANEMSRYKHELDRETYRGIGARSDIKDRQRVAQLFLAKSAKSDVVLTKTFIDKVVSQVFGLTSLARGYTNK
jgi:hypothetical protein